MKQTAIEVSINTNKIFYLNRLEKRAYHKFIKYYSKPSWFYNAKMINDILYNEKTHYVEMFKEYLLYEDYNEFLRQYYGKTLISIKLKKILNFYDKYSKIFPNYTSLRESKYIYKNIKRKQKIINQINEKKIKEQEISEDIDSSDNNNSSYSKTIFNTKVINLIYTEDNTLTINKNNEKKNLASNDDNKSLFDVINKISEYEKKETNKQKNNNNFRKKQKIEPYINNKREEKINYKKLTNLLFNSSNLNINTNNNNIKNNNNSLIKNNNIKIDFKKNLVDKNWSINNNKIKLNQYNNYISKQKSFSNIIYPKQKICGTIKYSNYNKKNINNNIFELYKSKKSKKISLKNNINYEKFKKILLSTNSTNSPKIMTERMFSSPRKIQNIKSTKRCISNSKKIKDKKNKNTINNVKKNISSNTTLKKKSTSRSRKKKNNNSNISFTNLIKKDQNLIKHQIISINNIQKSKKIYNYKTNNQNKLCRNNNISHINLKNKNTRKNNTYNSNNKNRIVNNYNIVNGVMNNSTQINIFTGGDIIKSVNLYMNSIIKSPSSFHSSKTHSKNNKKIKNMKQFFHKQINSKNYKEPFTERNSSNDKLLKLLDIYCRGEKHRKTNIKKSHFNMSKLNKSHNYKTKSKSKSNWEERSAMDFIKKNNVSNNKKKYLIEMMNENKK